MKVLAILGPTGSGKSRLALEVAERIPAEIISCDSVQVYQGFDIGTDKVPKEIRKKIPHHLLDIISDCHRFSAADFSKLASEKIKDIWRRGKIPIIVGGTFLYFRALQHGLFPFSSPGENFREKWKNSIKELRRRTMEIDPHYYVKIGPNDLKRMVRVMEVFYISGKNMTEASELTRPPLKGVKFLKFAIDLPRDELYRRIEERTENMFLKGLVEEVRNLLALGYPEDCPPFEAIGYRETLAFIKGEITLDEAKKMVIKNTKEYARRQIMWLRTEKDIIWIKPWEIERILEAVKK